MHVFDLIMSILAIAMSIFSLFQSNKTVKSTTKALDDFGAKVRLSEPLCPQCGNPFDGKVMTTKDGYKCCMRCYQTVFMGK